MAIIPIWKDKSVYLGGGQGVQFRIKTNDSIIYSGRVFPKPGAVSNYMRVNDILADYLRTPTPAFLQAVDDALTLPVTFDVEVYLNEDEGWDWVDTLEVINDWSYDPSFNVSTMGLAAPITRRVASTQVLVQSSLNATETATLKYKNGTTSTLSLSVSRNCVVLDLADYAGLQSVTIGTITYEVVELCNQFALYYVNAFGGWDSLLIEGNTIEVDNVTRHLMETEYDNSTLKNRGTRNYVNEMDKSFTMHTSWLSDDESSRMHHLLNSTNVYMCNILSGQILPVTLTNTTTEYKTYKGNGGRLVNYAIEVKVAQERLRR